MSTYQKRHKIAVLTVAAYTRPPASSRWLIESCRRQGIELTVIGQGRKYANNYCKIGLIAEYLSAHRELEYVLAVDFRDVIFCGPMRELFSKYQSYDRAIVAAAERHSWPIPSHNELVPPTGSTFAHLNSGTIFSTVDGWLDAWQWMQRRKRELRGMAPEVGAFGLTLFTSDQAAWSDLYIHGDMRLGLDYKCQMFQALATIDADVGSANSDLLLEGRRVLNRETGGRPCVLHANGSVPVEPWGRFVQEPSTVWNGPLIQRIRTAPRDRLQDIEFVARLLLDLGLHEIHNEYVDDALLPYCNKGLGIWQQPYEFAKYLVWLSNRPPIHSYLEIGVATGGSFITTIEYLRRFHPLQVACGVDPKLSHQVHDYCLRTPGVHFIQATSASQEVERFLRLVGGVDLILIDSEHTRAAAEFDWALARRHARYVAFHDIASGRFPGVCSLWNDIRTTYAQTYDFTDDEHFKPWGLGVVDLGFGVATNEVHS